MGWFENLKSYFANRAQNKIARYTKLVKNPKAIKEDRQAALEYFISHKDPIVAVPALLERFEYSLEHGINDTREKESALNGIVKHKDAAIPIIQAQLLRTTKIAWPIKALNSIGQESLVIETLKTALNFTDVAFDQAQVDKNYDILCYMRDFKVPGFHKELAHFLQDSDERVRFAAIEALLEQGDDDIPAIVEPFLVDETNENRRIRQGVLDAFLTKKWKLKQKDRFANGHVVGNIFVNSHGILELKKQ